MGGLIFSHNMFKTQQTFQEFMEGHPQEVIAHFCQTEIKWKPDWRELYILPLNTCMTGNKNRESGGPANIEHAVS